MRFNHWIIGLLWFLIWALLSKVAIAAEGRSVLRTTQPLAKHHVIEAADLVIKSEAGTVPKPALSLPGQAIGLELRTPISAGSLLMPWMLQQKTVVFRDNPVQIFCEGKDFLLKVAGVALQDGGLHQWIRVKNADSQKILLAEVIDGNSVRVTGE